MVSHKVSDVSKPYLLYVRKLWSAGKSQHVGICRRGLQASCLICRPRLLGCLRDIRPSSLPYHQAVGDTYLYRFFLCIDLVPRQVPC